MSHLLPAPLKAYEVLPDMPPPASRGGGSSSSTLPSTALVPAGDAAAALVLQHHAGRATVHTRFTDLVPVSNPSALLQPRPSGDAVTEAAARTSAALQGVVSGAMAAARSGASAVSAAASAAGADSARIIRYTPDEDAPGFNPAARTRIIKVVTAASDPLEPPKFKHKKMPGGPPEAPVPVMHSPTRKVTAEDAAAWKIPPCISNYRNPKGFVIPLDKRIAADGRSLMEAAVSDHRAQLSEVLQIAARKARLEVETRAAVQRKLAQKQQEESEAELRALAARSRLERMGVAGAAGLTAEALEGSGGGGGAWGDPAPPLMGTGEPGASRVADNRPAWLAAAAGGGGSSSSSGGGGGGGGGGGDGGGGGGGGSGGEGVGVDGPSAPRSSEESEASYAARLQREAARRDFRREQESSLRAAAAGRRAGKEVRDEDRDVSERVALGMGGGGGGGGGDALFDARLFNQGGGVKSGFAAEDDEETAYDRAWRGGEASLAGLYRPRAAASGPLADAAAAAAVEGLAQGAAKRFKAGGEGADFEGVVPAARPPAGASRAPGPVEFERGGTVGAGAGGAAPPPPLPPPHPPAPGADVFGLDDVLGFGGGGAAAPRANALAGIGRGGRMATAAGGASRTAAELAGGSGRSHINFVSGTM
jgi:SNW domain-containing protein 1